MVTAYVHDKSDSLEVHDVFLVMLQRKKHQHVIPQVPREEKILFDVLSSVFPHFFSVLWTVKKLTHPVGSSLNRVGK